MNGNFHTVQTQMPTDSHWILCQFCQYQCLSRSLSFSQCRPMRTLQDCRSQINTTTSPITDGTFAHVVVSTVSVTFQRIHIVAFLWTQNLWLEINLLLGNCELKWNTIDPLKLIIIQHTVAIYYWVIHFQFRVPTFSDRQNSMIFPWFFQIFFSKFPGMFFIIFKVWFLSGFEYKYANFLSFIWTKN